MNRLKLVPHCPEPDKGKEVGYENPVLQAKLEKAKKEMGRKHCLHPKTVASINREVLNTWRWMYGVSKKA